MNETRAQTLSALANEPLDLLVIGGGIVGAGVARDAALRSLKIGLIDRHDFAFGTSSRSSRLLHGGIRYLSQGRIRLVREANVEKGILHRIAPHLADPLPFCFPAYRGQGWPLWQLRIGVKLYDLLCGHERLGNSHGLSRRETINLLPGLKQDGLTGAVRYFDGFTNDARLVIDTLRSAHAAGARVANYVCFISVDTRAKEFISSARDEITGSNFTIRSRAVVNATGPWTQNLGLSKIQLRPTKGIHLIFQSDRLPTNEAVVITESGRILFVLPWGKRTLVGTTDTDFNGPPESVQVEPADIEYLLQTANQFFPDAKLQPADILGSYAGLRPLIAHSKGRPSDISRSHVILQSTPGWWDVAGGKLTTHRLMAEQTIDAVTAHLGRKFLSCSTATLPLLTENDPKIGILPPEPTQAWVQHFLHHEWALTVEDVMTRRTSWRLYQPNPAQTETAIRSWMNLNPG